ncbi:unnamed protein product, partial [Discosporangium mesarthrocarpum]
MSLAHENACPRSKLGRSRANSAEFVSDLAEEDQAMFMPEGDKRRMGGTMRLGSRTTLLKPGSLAYKLY